MDKPEFMQNWVEEESHEREGPRAFKYVKPALDHMKHVVTLARTDRMLAGVQVLKEGGENNLHSHSSLDGFWMVLKGRVKFHGENDVLLGEFGPLEGILIPRGVQYGFESSSEEDLELLQVEAFNIPMKSIQAIVADRVNFKAVRKGTTSVRLHEGRED